MREEYSGEAVPAGHNPDVTIRAGNPCHRLRLREDGSYSGRADELWCLPHFSSGYLPGSPGSPGLPSFCCTESEDSLDF